MRVATVGRRASVPDGLGGADVHEHCAVEGVCDGSELLDDEDAVVEHLAREEGVDVEQEGAQVQLAVPVRNDDRHPVSRRAVPFGGSSEEKLLHLFWFERYCWKSIRGRCFWLFN